MFCAVKNSCEVETGYRLGHAHMSYTRLPTHSLDVDGREHVLEHGGHQLAGLLLRGEVIQHQLRGEHRSH